MSALWDALVIAAWVMLGYAVLRPVWLAIRDGLRRRRQQRQMQKAMTGVSMSLNRVASTIEHDWSYRAGAGAPFVGGNAVRWHRDADDEDDDQDPFYGVDPSEIPDDAKSRSWPACHLFRAGAKLPERGMFGLVCEEPPLAMVCPECDHKEPVLQSGGRACGYCGARRQVHGLRVFWWFPKLPEA